MGANNDMRTQSGGSSGTNPLAAPWLRPTGDESYPLGIINDVLGGPHIYDSVQDCVDTLKRGLMVKGMPVTINQNVIGQETIKRTRYYLETVPSITNDQVISDIPSYDFSNYFKIDVNAVSDVDGSIEAQYAPDYLGAKPLFDIGSTWYNNGEASSSDTAVIWLTDYDAKIPHVWQRQRNGPTSDWGIPIKVFGEGYESGSYPDNRFQWVLKANPAPNRPPQTINGAPNNEPAGWDNVPDNFPDTDYNTSILTYNLYRITVIKDTKGDITGNWVGPLLISDDPNLVRFGDVGNNIDYLNDTYWRAYYTPDQDKYMASREDLGGGNYTEWVVSQIDDENGEYFDYVYKAFPLGYTVTDADKPTIKEPYTLVAPNDWSSDPVTAGINKIQHISKIRKTIQGDMIGQWSTPTRWDGMDTVQNVISSDAGNIFKYTDGGVIPSPTAIVLSTKLYRGITEVTTGLTYKWYKGPIHIDNQMADVTSQITINPADVSSEQVYNSVITFEGNDYPDDVSIIDVTDGADFVSYIKATDGFIFKEQAGVKLFDPEFYKNGTLNNTGVAFVWKLDGVIQTESDSGSGTQNVDPITKKITITGTDITTSAVLKIESTYNTIVYERSETIADIADGISPIIQYSTDATTTPPASVGNWVSDSTGANWMRISVDDGVSFGAAILVKGESGTKEAGLSLLIFKNIDDDVDSVPTAPLVPASGSLIPAGWTDVPTVFVGGQDVTYMTSCNFVLVSDGDTSVLTRANWNPLTASYGTPIKATGKDGVAIGLPGDPGDPGEKGWSPEFALIADGSRQVLELVDWQGGAGTKPAYGNLYVGTTGLVSTKAAAVKVNGNDGEDGSFVFSEVIASRTSDYNNTSSNPNDGDVIVSKTITNTSSLPSLILVNCSVTFSATVAVNDNFVEIANSTSLGLNISKALFSVSVGDYNTVSLSAMDVIQANSSKTFYFRVRNFSGLSGLRRQNAHIHVQKTIP